MDYGGRRFSYAIWETDLGGFDARKYQDVVLRIKGQKGGEQPNFYLADAATRRCVRAKEVKAISAEWQNIRIPLEKFSTQGVDLSHLESLQLVFEWKEMSGTMYVDEIRFEKNTIAGKDTRGDRRVK